MNEITKELIDSADSEYREFSSKLIPNVDKETVLGVRAPICKAIAKKFTGTHEGDSFLLELPHKYHDENIVHGYMLGMIGTREQIENFLPHMNSWAVVDTTVAGLKKFFKKPDEVYGFVKNLISSKHEYTVRFGIVSLMSYYLDGEHVKEAIDLVKRIKREEFYIKMAQAWFFATALTKQYELAVRVVESRELDAWVHNKSIQKARESLRVSKERKEYLNGLKEKI